jgi:hypothetical protein
LAGCIFKSYFVLQSAFKMKNRFRLSRKYFALTLLLFAAEVFIGACLHDAVIRPFGGDFLVVILMYCFVKTVMNIPVNTAAAGVLITAYVVEVSQYFKLVAVLGLKRCPLANILLSNSFSWIDMLMYTLGALLVVGLEKLARKQHLLTGAD